MRIFTMIAGIVCLFAVLFDAFQTIILPRRATGRFRLTRLFYIVTWGPWSLLHQALLRPAQAGNSFQLLRAHVADSLCWPCGRRGWCWAFRWCFMRLAAHSMTVAWARISSLTFT